MARSKYTTVSLNQSHLKKNKTKKKNLIHFESRPVKFKHFWEGKDLKGKERVYLKSFKTFFFFFFFDSQDFLFLKSV